MTLEQVQQIFNTQLQQNPQDLFYIVIETSQASVIRFRLDQRPIEDLVVELQGLEYEPGLDSTPKFRKI